MQDQPGRLVERIGGAMAVGDARALEPLDAVGEQLAHRGHRAQGVIDLRRAVARSGASFFKAQLSRRAAART
jgi:hypothetical protein